MALQEAVFVVFVQVLSEGTKVVKVRGLVLERVVVVGSLDTCQRIETLSIIQ